VPVGNGDPAISVNAPVDVLIVKTETVFDDEFATKTTVAGPGVPDGVPVSMTGFEIPVPAPAQPANDASSTNETRIPNAQLIRFILSLLSNFREDTRDRTLSRLTAQNSKPLDPRR
jgi:hypothetical protein